MKPHEGKTIIISFHGDIPLANRAALVHREPSFLPLGIRYDNENCGGWDDFNRSTIENLLAFNIKIDVINVLIVVIIITRYDNLYGKNK